MFSGFTKSRYFEFFFTKISLFFAKNQFSSDNINIRNYMLNDNFPTTIFLSSGDNARQLTGSFPVRNLKYNMVNRICSGTESKI